MYYAVLFFTTDAELGIKPKLTWEELFEKDSHQDKWINYYTFKTSSGPEALRKFINCKDKYPPIVVSDETEDGLKEKIKQYRKNFKNINWIKENYINNKLKFK